MKTLTRRGVEDAAAGLSLHFLHMSEGPFSHDAGHMEIENFYIHIDIIRTKMCSLTLSVLELTLCLCKQVGSRPANSAAGLRSILFATQSIILNQN